MVQLNSISPRADGVERLVTFIEKSLLKIPGRSSSLEFTWGRLSNKELSVIYYVQS